MKLTTKTESAVEAAAQVSSEPIQYPAAGVWHHAPSPAIFKRIRLTRYFTQFWALFSLTSIAITAVLLWGWKPPATPLGIGVLVALALMPHVGEKLMLLICPDRTTAKDRQLVDQSSEPEAIVEVWVKVDGRFASWDRGVLGMVDNALYFSGHSFSFLIGSQDVCARFGLPIFDRPDTFAMHLSHPSHAIMVRVAWLKDKSKHGLEADAELKSAVAKLRKLPPTTLARQYPPLERWSESEPAVNSLKRVVGDDEPA